MPTRTVKGPLFTIVVDGKRITVKHIYSKGKRCRVIVPDGVTIEFDHKSSQGSDPPRSTTETAKSLQPLNPLRSRQM